jgi:hypothetical protein
MKTSSIILSAIIILVVTGSLSAQNFFPLKIGNKNQYKINWTGHGPGGGTSGTSYGKYSINGDSVINGEKFYKLSLHQIIFFEPPPRDNILFHYDTTIQKLFVKFPDDTIRLAADFNLPTDSSITSYISGKPRNYISHGITTDTLYGIPVQVFQMTLDSTNIDFIYRFAENFGLLYNYYYRAIGITWGITHRNLISSIIDSAAYNPLTLEITSLSPLDDRPIDTFPFVLNGSYSAPIPYLVDSFYVSIIHTRADTIMNSWILEFENGMVNIPIYSASLQVGDKVKLMAKATDESIFENVAYYPDTGYAIINVLPPTVGIKTEEAKLIYKLGQNYPNPFNPSTTISFSISERARTTLRVYDIIGNEITTLINEERDGGNYTISFDASGLTSGIYFYRLTSGGISQSKKMLLIK